MGTKTVYFHIKYKELYVYGVVLILRHLSSLPKINYCFSLNYFNVLTNKTRKKSNSGNPKFIYPCSFYGSNVFGYTELFDI